MGDEQERTTLSTPSLDCPSSFSRLERSPLPPRPPYPYGLLTASCPDPADSSIAPLYYLIRRPIYILDFALTLTFNHLLFTTYYAKAFPTSFYFWVVQALGAILMIVFGEQVSGVFFSPV